MHVDVLSAEIGSTTTVVSAFLLKHGSGEVPRFLGQGSAPTSVLQGDVRVGLEAAIADLSARLKGAGILTADESLSWETLYACSSAAGGLRMTVHGLVYDMTVKAAREAALGAGANIRQVTAGPLRPEDLQLMLEISPNLIMIAGGVDYGERDTALANSRLIRDALEASGLSIPILYAGNIENQQAVRNIFAGSGLPLYICENVYPRIDELVIEPARRLIQEVFEEHIIKAPGMEHIREMVNGSIMPVPGAVMRSAELLQTRIGDLLVVDVGGATSDVHSVCSDSPQVERILIAPEPFAKRSVEGDLGVYINRHSVLNLLKGSGRPAMEDFLAHCGSTEDKLPAEVEALPPIPSTPAHMRLAESLAAFCGRTALERHAGRFRDMYTISGKKTLAEGKDLSGVQQIIGTGGALTRLPGGENILRQIINREGTRLLLPSPDIPVYLDSYYIMASLGTMAADYPEQVASLLSASIHADTQGTLESSVAKNIHKKDDI